jgi:acetyl-CoA synthetase (ADP-forming)
MPPSVAQKIIEHALRADRKVLLEPEAKNICRAYNMPTPEFSVAMSPREAAEVAERIGFPVVLKIVSMDILHKTEANAVVLDLKTGKEVEEGYQRVVNNATSYNRNARLEGVIVQHMAPNGVEVIVGGLRDSQFGPTILFGLGGIFVEVLKDATFRVAPLTDLDAWDMIREIHSYPVLKGVRGQGPADELAIASIIQAASRVMMENASIEQMDLNPIMVYASGASIVDARMILGAS